MIVQNWWVCIHIPCRKTFAGGQYALVLEDDPGVSWSQAKQKCENAGAKLASIVSYEIQVTRIRPENKWFVIIIIYLRVGSIRSLGWSTTSG